MPNIKLGGFLNQKYIVTHTWVITKKNSNVFKGRLVEYKSDKDKKLSIKRYPEKIRSHLLGMINDLENPVNGKCT